MIYLTAPNSQSILQNDINVSLQWRLHLFFASIAKKRLRQCDNLPMNPVAQSSPFVLLVVQNRGRLAEKRTIPLPPNRVPKKELASIFSSDDSEGSERASGDHAHIKQEEDLHYSIMRKR